MSQHAVFVAPFLMEATLRFLEGAASLAGVRLSLISQDPVEGLPASLRQRLAGHWRVDNGLDPEQIVAGARRLGQEVGEVARMFGPLEQLQVPLAAARERMALRGSASRRRSTFATNRA